MADSNEELERKIEVIRASFTGKLAGRLAEIKQAAEELKRANTPQQAESARNALNLTAHTLAGSATTFGFAKIGQVAADIEAITETLESSEMQQLNKLSELIDDLEGAITDTLKSTN